MISDRLEIEEVLKRSGSVLKLQLYIVTSTATHLEEVKQNMEAHRAFLKDLEDQNVLFAQDHC